MIRRPPRSPLFPPTTLSHSLLLISQAAAIVLLMMIPPIEVIYAKESLGVGDSGFGALLTAWGLGMVAGSLLFARERRRSDRKSTRLNSSHANISYAVFCLKK